MIVIWSMGSVLFRLLWIQLLPDHLEVRFNRLLEQFGKLEHYIHADQIIFRSRLQNRILVRVLIFVNLSYLRQLFVTPLLYLLHFRVNFASDYARKVVSKNCFIQLLLVLWENHLVNLIWNHFSKLDRLEGFFFCEVIHHKIADNLSHQLFLRYIWMYSKLFSFFV